MSKTTTLRKTTHLYRHSTDGTHTTTSMGSHATSKAAWQAAAAHGYDSGWFYTTKERWEETPTLAASIREALEDGSYQTFTATDKVAYIQIGGGDPSRQNAQAAGAATLRNAGINAHHLYRAHQGWHIKATAWA